MRTSAEAGVASSVASNAAITKVARMRGSFAGDDQIS
jgi:hypothetical protein